MIAVEPILMGWLVVSQTDLVGFLRGVVLSSIWIPVLFGAKVLLDLRISGPDPPPTDRMHYKNLLRRRDAGT
jgi:hypothetical protein